MYKKAVASRSISSVLALSKEHISKQYAFCSSPSLNTFHLLRNFSLASQRSDIPNVDGYNVDNGPEYYNLQSGFNGESQKPTQSQTSLPNVQSSRRTSTANEGEFSGRFSLEVQQSSNLNWESSGAPRNNTVSNPNGRNANSTEFHGLNYGRTDTNSYGFNQYNNAPRWESYKDFNQNDQEIQNSRSYAGQNSGNWTQFNGYADSSDNFQRSLNSFHQGHYGNFGGSSQTPSQYNPNQYGGSSASYANNKALHGQDLVGSQLNPIRGEIENPSKPYNSSPDAPREMSQNSNSYNSKVFSEFDTPSTSNIGQVQVSVGNHLMGNSMGNKHTVNVYNHHPTLGQYEQNYLSAQYQENFIPEQQQLAPSYVQYQLAPSYVQYQQHNYVAQHQPNQNADHNSTVSSQASDFVAEGQSNEFTESSISRGTLEQFDGLCNEAKVKEAIDVLGLLEKDNISVDLPRYSRLMHACGEAKLLQEAKAIHEHLVRSQSPLEVSMYNRILEMYLKCGSVDDATLVFNKMSKRNLTSWDAMITGLAKNGLGEDAIDYFTQFKNAGLKPDGKMFIGVFSACSILGDVKEGMLHFESMSYDYGIIPFMDHYNSIVNMMGSVGHLDEALEFIEKMPVEADAGIWETMMNLCRVHGHVEIGDRCAELVEQLDRSHLNEQSKAGLVPIKDSVFAKEKERKKLASENPLEVKSRVHRFRAGDTSQPENDRIYTLLRGMREQMKEAGYIPETRFVLHDIDQEGKNDALLAHSERLAVAHGLLSSPARLPIKVLKNLRVCGDCHNALKIISKIVGRELIMRDTKRFHHFKDGLCSCRDYW